MKDSVSEILGNLDNDIQGEKLSFGELVGKFEDRGFGPLLLIPSLLAFLPTGAIPGVPSLCGITIFLICIQVAVNKDHPWLPKRLKQQAISREKILTGVDKAQPYVSKVEHYLRPRARWLSSAPLKNLIAIYCGAAALCMIPLELLPFAAALPSFALAITAIGMTNRDGLFIGIGIVLQLGTVYLVMQAMNSL
ncbi:exopolysaccharide biosynthesis protein [Alteromonas halophila]|uniref:exopolysaccharide biosynthesis protein n=1 Tax=Alteromonas halophila TaxID=516698 RepID=UPI001677516A|nr:exopolysaccharide biosynthesis protein [Alteromonas halophila]